MTSPFRIEALTHQHDRARFRCGSDPLDRYFTRQVTQDVRRRVTACFVAVEQEREILAGYYTLAAASVLFPDLPNDVRKKLPRYPSVPAIRMGRLAVAQEFKGRGLGAALLADALARSLNTGIAAFALLVDAKDDGAAAFYRHHGFISFKDNPLTLFLPLATAQILLANRHKE